MKPEDVRDHLAARAHREPRSIDSESIGIAKAAAAPGTVTIETTAAAHVEVKEAAILASISASYFLLRRGMAIIALAFPLVLWLVAGPGHLQGSISAYYHFAATGLPDGSPYGGGSTRNIFVGVLWAIGAFLYLYKGYGAREDIALNIAGIAAVLIACLPMDWPVVAGAPSSLIGTAHYVSAAIFFLAIAYVSIACSGDTLRIMDDKDRQARFRRTYRILGTLMIVVPATIYLIRALLPVAENYPVVLLIEVAGIAIFSIFWLVKSREIAILEKQ